MDVFGAPETGPGSKVRFSPGTDNAKKLALNKTIAEGNVSSADILLDKDAAAEKVKAANAAKAAEANEANAALRRGRRAVIHC